jgi:hypothetical protein
VVAKLKDLVDSPERLMAVTGFYQSLDTTKKVIKQLSTSLTRGCTKECTPRGMIERRIARELGH